jgi:hypothetical protein
MRTNRKAIAIIRQSCSDSLAIANSYGRSFRKRGLALGRPNKTEKEKEALIDLARTWMQATLESESTFVVNSSPLEARAP